MNNQVPHSAEELEKQVSELEHQLMRARGELAMQRPDYALKRLQELGFQPQMAEIVDLLMRKGAISRTQISAEMKISLDACSAVMTKIRKRLDTQFGISIGTAYSLDEKDVEKLNNAIRGIMPEPSEKKEE
jgi:hypothetical protein